LSIIELEDDSKSDLIPIINYKLHERLKNFVCSSGKQDPLNIKLKQKPSTHGPGSWARSCHSAEWS